MAMKNIPTVTITVNNIISSTGILTPYFTETKEHMLRFMQTFNTEGILCNVSNFLYD